MAVNKKKRTKKISAGERRSSLPIKLTEVAKALMGKGLVASTKDAECSPWRGSAEKRGQR